MDSFLYIHPISLFPIVQSFPTKSLGGHQGLRTITYPIPQPGASVPQEGTECKAQSGFLVTGPVNACSHEVLSGPSVENLIFFSIVSMSYWFHCGLCRYYIDLPYRSLCGLSFPSGILNSVLQFDNEP